MTRNELLAILIDCATNDDQEVGHLDADRALLAYINDPGITAAFDAIDKWYS